MKKDKQLSNKARVGTGKTCHYIDRDSKKSWDRF